MILQHGHRLEQKAPVCIMARALLENVLSPERSDAIYSQYDHKQLDGVLLFSRLSKSWGWSGRGFSRRFMQYQTKVASAEIAVTVKAVYDKLQRIRGGVSQARCDKRPRERKTFSKKWAIRRDPLPGYTCGFWKATICDEPSGG